MDRTPIVGEVCEDDAKIDEACEDTGTETSNGSRCDLSEVYRSDNYRLSNTESGNEAASVDDAEVATVTHEHGNADNPKSAEFACGPDTTDAITYQEGAI